LTTELRSIIVANLEKQTPFAGGLIQAAMEETVLLLQVANKPVHREPTPFVV
jgi:hypothetical protein